VAGAWARGEFPPTPHNRPAPHTNAPVPYVSGDLRHCCRKLEVVLSGNASEFRSNQSREATEPLDAERSYICSNRPETNRCAERL
jgi:hypothetical protein